MAALTIVRSTRHISLVSPTSSPERAAPLSYEQERGYLFEDPRAGATTSNVAFVHWLSGDLDVPALVAAITELHRRHEVLRTRYRDATTQEVLPPDGKPLDDRDLSAAIDPAAVVRRLVRARVSEPFDLAEPPVRWALYPLGPGRHALTLTAHRIAVDTRSKALIDHEISVLYRASRTGRPAELAPPGQYADYATAQRTHPGSEADLDRWVKELADPPGPVRLPFDHAPTPRTGHAAAVTRTAAPHHLVATAAHPSRFLVLLTGFAWQLGRYGDGRDIVLGVPAAHGAESVLGRVTDVRPCRVRLTGAPTFRALLAQLHATTVDGDRYGRFSAERLVAALRPPREPGREPLVQVTFGRGHEGRLDLDGLTVVAERSSPPSTTADLAVTVTERSDGVDMAWCYRTALFDAATVDELAAELTRLVRWATAHPDTPLTAFTDWSRTRIPAAGRVLPRVRARTAPRSELEKVVAHIWCETLGLDAVDVDEDFHGLGGHSLAATRVVALLAEHLPGLPDRGLLPDLLHHPTVAEFATVLAHRMLAHATRQAAIRMPASHRGHRFADGQGRPPWPSDRCRHPVVEDLPRQAPQRPPRLHPELVDEQLPCVPVLTQRLRLPARVAQGDHQLVAQPLPEREARHQRHRLPDDVRGPAEPVQ